MKSAAEALDLLAKDSGEDAVTRVCAEIADWAKDGHALELAQLVRGLEAASSKQHVEAYEKVADLVEDQLALTADEQAVEAIIALSNEERTKSLVEPRSDAVRQCAFASRLGYAQTKATFVAALERHAGEPRELFACWLQELVLRRVALFGEPRAAAFAADLAKTGHPLGGLPIELRPLEREAPSYMPLYGDRGLTGVLEALASGPMSGRSMPPPSESKQISVKEHDASPMLAAAVRPWTEGKSSRVETRVFDLGTSLETRHLGSWLLRSLPLDSTKDVAKDGLECKRVGVDDVFGPLFAAAANGGSTSSGLGGAYGRRAAWTSLGALVGLPDGATIEAIEAAAKQTSFLSFAASGPWFHDVAWDLGILALEPGGKRVVVLAATDAE